MANTAIRTPALTDDRAAEEAWSAHELRVQGWSLRRIGTALGLGKDTVQRRLEWAQKQILLPVVLEYRKTQNERLENLLALTLDGIREPLMYEGTHCQAFDGTPLYLLNLERVKAARALINDLSDLHGVKAPVQMEHRMIEITDEDMALVEEMQAAVRVQMEARGWSSPAQEAEEQGQ